MRPAGREIPYDVARYLALDTLAAVGGLAGFSIAGPPGMLAGFLATAVARGVVSGTIGVIRARAAGRWATRQRQSYATTSDQRPEPYVGSRTAGHLRERTGPRNGRSDGVRRARDERARRADGPVQGR